MLTIQYTAIAIYGTVGIPRWDLGVEQPMGRTVPLPSNFSSTGGLDKLAIIGISSAQQQEECNNGAVPKLSFTRL